jgi:hypothetical protein
MLNLYKYNTKKNYKSIFLFMSKILWNKSFLE